MFFKSETIKLVSYNYIIKTKIVSQLKEINFSHTLTEIKNIVSLKSKKDAFKNAYKMHETFKYCITYFKLKKQYESYTYQNLLIYFKKLIFCFSQFISE